MLRMQTMWGYLEQLPSAEGKVDLVHQRDADMMSSKTNSCRVHQSYKVPEHPDICIQADYH